MVTTAALAALRRDAKRVTRNANRKVSRLERRQGLDFSLPQADAVDPRRSSDQIDRMTSRQLNAYLDRVSSFNDRSTKFVRGSRGAPISLVTASRFEAEQRSAARAAQSRARQAAERLGETFDASAARGFPNTAFSDQVVDISTVTGERSARRLTQAARRRQSPAFERQEGMAAKRELDDLARQTGSAQIMSAIASLTPRQAAAAQSSTAFMDTLVKAIKSPEDGIVVEAQEPEQQAVLQRVEWIKSLV